VSDVGKIINRLKELLAKDYVLEGLLKDPRYRRKLLLAISILGLEDVLLDRVVSLLSQGAYQEASWSQQAPSPSSRLLSTFRRRLRLSEAVRSEDSS